MILPYEYFDKIFFHWLSRWQVGRKLKIPCTFFASSLKYVLFSSTRYTFYHVESRKNIKKITLRTDSFYTSLTILKECMTHKQTVKCVQPRQGQPEYLSYSKLHMYTQNSSSIYDCTVRCFFTFVACLKCSLFRHNTLEGMTFKRWIFPWAVSTVRLTLCCSVVGSMFIKFMIANTWRASRDFCFLMVNF